MIPSLLDVCFLLHSTRKFDTANHLDICTAMQHGWWMMIDATAPIVEGGHHANTSQSAPSSPSFFRTTDAGWC